METARLGHIAQANTNNGDVNGLAATDEDLIWINLGHSMSFGYVIWRCCGGTR